MVEGFGRTLRYVWSWSRGARVVRREIGFERDGVRLPATLYLPRARAPRGAPPRPGWIVLGGVTRKGRHHPQLTRFARALSSSGAAVLVPEVPEWRDLHLAPELTLPTAVGAVRRLRGLDEVLPERFGLVGLSFGAPQAAIAATRPELAPDVAAVVLFGGYCDLARTVRCQFTGLHEWDGAEYRLDPDPYGRWVLARNYLTRVPGFEGEGAVAEGLGRMALAATERRIPAWDPAHEPLRREIRSGLDASSAELFDRFAPPPGAPPLERSEAEAFADRLSAACRETQPLLEPLHHLADLGTPVHLIHGRGDRLIPCTESLRTARHLPRGLEHHVTLTGLFAHSAVERQPGPWQRVREQVRLFQAMRRLINAV